jgi:hypothetical protein
VVLEVLRISKDADEQLSILLARPQRAEQEQLTNLAARWTQRVEVMIKPGIEMP